MDLAAAGSGGVGQDPGIDRVGLGLARVEVCRSAHDQTRDIRDWDSTLGGDRERELADRTWLVDHQPRRAVERSLIEDHTERCLVVGDWA